VLGQIIGNYRVVAELGRGGMGVVYRAEHVQLGRPAALKVLLPQMSSDAQIVQRFFNEARAASSIDHPGIVEVYDFGRHTDGSAYLVMELLKGESLDHRLMRPIAPLEAASLIAQVAGALAAAHARGIIHRDLKPDNIFLVPNELLPGGIQVKLLDFGIAKLADERASGFRTQTGVLIGTPAYMSPEQCMGRPDLDHRTDLYAVGCILFHMLCGRPPFYSEQGTGVMIAMHLRDPVPDPRSLAPHLPPALVGIMLRLLEKDPAARFQSAQELRQALVAAGAIAPMTAPNAGANADPYGATMAPAPPAGARSGPPSMPGDTLGMAGYGHGHGHPDVYAATGAAGYGHGHGRQDAYAATAMLGSSPTTRSGAAAELMTQPERVRNRGRAAPAPARGGGRRGAWIVVGALLIAGGGVTAGVALSGGGGGGKDAESQAKQPEGPATGPDREARAAIGPGSGREEAKPVVPPQPPQPPPEQPPETKTATAEAPCPAGQLRGEDTRGECCWAGQAWSTAKKRCIGAPTCPPGTRASGEQCVAAPAEADPGQRAPHGGPHIASDDPLALPPAPPTILLAGTSFEPGAPIAIRFTPAIRSTPARRAWVTVAPAGSPQTSYGTWTYVDDGARLARLAAPSKPGAYEVRLHTDYPAKSFNVVRAAAFTVAAPAEMATDQPAASDVTPLSGQRFTLGSQSVRAGDKVAVRFPGPLRAAPGEQFWITVIEAGEADTGWGKWEYVPKDARSMSLAVPDKAGTYEVRLHANYPKKSTNVVYRRPLRVEAD
jgi:hypothetical protein